jgi:hypothetical protein
MIMKPYEVGDLVLYVVPYAYTPRDTLGVVIEIDAPSGRPIVQWLDNNTVSKPDYDRMRPVEANNAV